MCAGNDGKILLQARRRIDQDLSGILEGWWCVGGREKKNVFALFKNHVVSDPVELLSSVFQNILPHTYVLEVIHESDSFFNYTVLHDKINIYRHTGKFI